MSNPNSLQHLSILRTHTLHTKPELNPGITFHPSSIPTCRYITILNTIISHTAGHQPLTTSHLCLILRNTQNPAISNQPNTLLTQTLPFFLSFLFFHPHHQKAQVPSLHEPLTHSTHSTWASRAPKHPTTAHHLPITKYSLPFWIRRRKRRAFLVFKKKSGQESYRKIRFTGGCPNLKWIWKTLSLFWKPRFFLYLRFGICAKTWALF